MREKKGLDDSLYYAGNLKGSNLLLESASSRYAFNAAVGVWVARSICMTAARKHHARRQSDVYHAYDYCFNQ